MNHAEEAALREEMLRLLLAVTPDAHEAYHHDAQFRAFLTTKVQLLVSELDSMVLASQARSQGLTAAAKALEHKVLTFTTPKPDQPA